MKNNKNLYIAVLIVAIIIVGIYFIQNKSESDVIKIGYFGPFTGPVAGDTGADIANGFKMAASEKSIAGGKKIEVIYEDDACDPKKAIDAVNKLVNVDKVKILVSGVCSGSTLAAAPIAEKNKIILLTPVSTSPKITDAGDYVFRTSASSIYTAEAASKLINSLGYTKVGILFEVADFTVGWKDSFVKRFESESSNRIMGAESVASKDTDVKIQLLRLAQAKPDVIVMIMNSTVTVNQAVKQVHDLKINIPIVGNDYFGVRSVVTNSLAEGIYASIYKYDGKSLALQNLLKKYEEQFKAQPSTEIYPALAYDGYNVLFNAIDICKSDNPECLKAELYKVKNYQGVSGTISIDKNGDTLREFTLKRIHNGVLEDVR